MKKYLALGLSTVMAFSFVGLVACDTDNGKPSAEVKGNYTKVTADNVAQFDSVISTVNPESFIGDPTKADFKLGASVFADLDISVNEISANGEYYKTQISLDADLNAMATKAPETATDSLGGVYLKAMGEVSFTSNTQNKDLVYDGDTSTLEESSFGGSFDGKAYVDTLTTYAEYDLVEKENGQIVEDGTSSGAVKVDTTMWLEEVLAILGDIQLPSMPAEETETSATLEMIQSMADMGITLAYESNGSGLKLKLSISEDTLEALLMDMVDYDESDTETSVSTAPVMKIKGSKLNVYLVLGKSGELVQVSADANVDASISYEGDSYQLKASGVLIVKMSNSVKVSLPSDLATNEKYEAITME